MGVRTSWKFGKFKFRKKIQVQLFLQFHTELIYTYSMNTVWIQYDYRENELPKFSGSPDPFFWCFEIFFVAFTFSRISKVDKYVDYIENAIKKIIFPSRNHQFLLYCINVFRIHLGVVWKRWKNKWYSCDDMKILCD